MLKKHLQMAKMLLPTLVLIIFIISGCGGGPPGGDPGTGGSSEKYELINQWGDSYLASGGTVLASNQFYTPSGLAIDGNGDVYVVDQTRVLKFNSTGTFLGWWGDGKDPGDMTVPTFGWYDAASSKLPDTAGDLFGAKKIGITGNYAYIAGHDQVFKLDLTSKDYLGWFGKSDFGNTDFYWHNPYTDSPTSEGWNAFFGTTDVIADDNGTIFVANTAQQIVQRITKDGTVLGWWGRDDSSNGWHSGNSANGTPSTGGANGQFAYPTSIDRYGNYIYIGDFYNFQKFNATTGEFIFRWDSSKIKFPQGVAIDNNCNIYICDLENIKKFDPNGNLLAQIPKVVQDVAVASNGDLYALDSTNCKVLVYRKQ